MRDLTAPLGAGFGRMLAAGACFFDANAEVDALGRGRREILVGMADGFVEDGDSDDGRVN